MVAGVSSVGIEWFVKQITKSYKKNLPIILLTKGLAIEGNELITLSDKIKKLLKDQGHTDVNISAIKGPCLATGLANKMRTGTVIANSNIKEAQFLKKIISTDYYSTEISSDIQGVEISGAIKNIYSMLIGASEGLSNSKAPKEIQSKYYLNTSASLIHRSISEMVEFVSFYGGRAETVYGLAANALDETAVARVFEAKERPADHPLIVHIASMDGLGDWADDVPEYAISLARDFWPGPMTLVVKRSGLAGDFVTGGQDTVGVRVPNHPVALGLLEAFARAGGNGVAAPSANRFGAVSPTTSLAVNEELENYLGSNDLILDGGSCHIGIESTIINCTDIVPTILRPGAITNEMVENSIGGRFNSNILESNITSNC